MPINSPELLAPAFSLMEQAEFHQHRGNIATAKSLWERIVADFDIPNFHLRRVEFLCSIGEFETAICELHDLFRRAVDRGNEDLKPVVAHHLAEVLRTCGDRHSAASWQQVAIGQTENSSPADLAGRAGDAFLAGEYDLAETLIRHSLAWEIQNGDREGEAADWGTLGLIHAGQDDFPGAVRCLGRAFALHRKIGDPTGMATDLLNLGELFGGRSDWRVAHRLFIRAKSVAGNSGNLVLEKRAQQRSRKAEKILGVANRSPQWN